MERITFSMSWRLKLLFQMINQSLFASQSWSVCSFGSGFIFYVPSAAFLIVDRSSWQLNRRSEGLRGGNWGALVLECRGQMSPCTLCLGVETSLLTASQPSREWGMHPRWGQPVQTSGPIIKLHKHRLLQVDVRMIVDFQTLSFCE